MRSNIKYYFGIDFGTTNSALVTYAINETGQIFIKKCGDDEERPIPSVVAIDNKGNVFTGREAWNKKMQLRESCEYFSSIKTILDSEKEYKINGKIWTTVDIAGEVFKHLKSIVKDRIDVDMTGKEAFISIPIGFSANKRSKLRQAAAKAGIIIKSFVSEPTAAFFANYKELKSSSIVAIFDWGGGTLDVSIIEHSNGKIFELATVGLSIAGDQIDKKIAERIHAKIARKKKGIDIAFSDMPLSAQDFMNVYSEQAKINLSYDDEAEISINQYGDYGICRETLSYDWFSEIIESEVNQAINCLDKAIEQSGLGLANIDRIVMIGGSSNLRPLIDKMEEKYGDKLFFPEETMWNVGQGAAMLAISPGDYHSNQSIGLVLSDGNYYELLKRGDLIKNWKHKCNFGVVDTSEQARFVFACKEGINDINFSVEDFKTLVLPNYKFLQEQIVLDAEIDSDMIFRVKAKSNMQPKNYSRVWQYEKLKCYYQLPGSDLNLWLAT